MGNRKTLTDWKGFSLIELIIVIAIMGVLIAILVPQYFAYVEKSRAAVCQTNLDTVRRAVSLYTVLPDGEVGDTLVNTLSLTKIDDTHYKGLCPDDGVYDITYDDTSGVFTIECEIHGQDSVTTVGTNLSKLYDLCNDYFSAPSRVNTTATLNSTGFNFGVGIKEQLQADLKLPSDNFDFRIYHAKNSNEYQIYIFQSIKDTPAGTEISATRYYFDSTTKTVTSSETGTAKVATQTMDGKDYNILDTTGGNFIVSK